MWLWLCYFQQVLNLFLALLLSSFGASNLSSPTADAETNKLAEAFSRIGRFIKWIKSLIRWFFSSIFGLCRKAKKQITSTVTNAPDGDAPAAEEGIETLQATKPKTPFDNNLSEAVQGKDKMESVLVCSIVVKINLFN